MEPNRLFSRRSGDMILARCRAALNRSTHGPAVDHEVQGYSLSSDSRPSRISATYAGLKLTTNTSSTPQRSEDYLRYATIGQSERRAAKVFHAWRKDEVVTHERGARAIS